MANSRKPLIIGNWKMHFNVHWASILVHHLDKALSNTNGVEVVLCPPFIALHPIYKTIDFKKFKLGAQNIHYADEGTFTGEISGQMLKDLVNYAIVGHSERRQLFGETDEMIARKLSAAFRNDITPILCIGETLFERQDQLTSQVLHDQLVADLTMLTSNEVAEVVIAYEPLWAISPGDGHGDIAKPEQIKQAVDIIRKNIKEMFGKPTADRVKVIYGGSVHADLTKDYLKISGLDGFLVGGASLNWHEFSEIIKIAQDSMKA